MQDPKHYPWFEDEQAYLPFDRSAWPPALLIAADADLGALELSHHWISFLLCEDPKLKEACGLCRSCHWLQAGHHPDFFELLKADEDKSIKIDAVRNLIASLSQTAHERRAQVVLIYPADSLNEAAANALLKSLEEPNDRVYFLLLSAYPLSLPATLRSRCQTYLLRAKQAQVLPWLQSRFPDKSEHSLQQALNLARGLPLAAERLLRAENNSADLWIDDCISVYLGQQSALIVAEKWVSRLQNEHLKGWAYFLQDLLRYQLSNRSVFLIYQDRLEAIKALVRRYSLDQWLICAQKVWDLYGQRLQGSNLNFQLSLECSLLALEGV